MPEINSQKIFLDIQEAATGNVGALTNVMETLVPYVHAQARKRCRKYYPILDASHDAADIASIAISKLLPPGGKGGLFMLRNPHALRSFVYRTTYYECVNLLRVKQKEMARTVSMEQTLNADGNLSLEDVICDSNAVLPGTPDDHSTDSRKEISVDELGTLIKECMGCLTSQERIAIMIRFQLEGAASATPYGKQNLATLAHVAEIMKVPIHDVNNWIYRGLKKLVKELQNRDYRYMATPDDYKLFQEVQHES